LQFIQNGERRVIHIEERGDAVFFLVAALMFIFVVWLLVERFRPEKKEDE
jgi:hypothetical protein